MKKNTPSLLDIYVAIRYFSGCMECGRIKLLYVVKEARFTSLFLEFLLTHFKTFVSMLLILQPLYLRMSFGR